jgi:LmbE family N-acetylglucosaminyl deacetylase
MTIAASAPEGAGIWAGSRRILVVLAHPDDPEFFCGGTLAAWARLGHHIEYHLLTCGDKGYNDVTLPEDINSDALCALRHREQREAASVIGVSAVHFLDRPDGYLLPDLELRREIVRLIRRMKPDILVTCDPQTLFTAYGINHPDHRAAGQAVLDAVFPAVGNAAYFPDLIEEGYPPHSLAEVWCSGSNQPTVTIDITDTWPVKMDALMRHRSQIGDPDKFKARMLSRRVEGTTEEHPRFEEKFRVVKYS